MKSFLHLLSESISTPKKNINDLGVTKITVIKWKGDTTRFSEEDLEGVEVYLIRFWLNNKVIGWAEYYDWGIVEDVEVKPEYRRMGIATKMYNAIEKHFNVVLGPANKQEEDGRKFWKNRFKSKGYY